METAILALNLKQMKVKILLVLITFQWKRPF